MTYNVQKTSGGVIAVQDGKVNTTDTSLALIGANAVNFGLYLNQNFVWLLQNFANNTAPVNPLIGQIWYDTVSATLKYYNGVVWKILTPPFDGAAGTATATIAGQSVAFTLAGEQIIYATSLGEISPALLPASVVISDNRYAVASRFPQGIAAGITLATDTHGFRFNGTASTANAFASNMTISVSGSASGNVSFNGSGNVGLTLSLSNVVTYGTYTKVEVGSNGLVLSGNTINSTDVVDALGYVPGIWEGAANSLTFGSNIILNGVVGGSNIFYGNSDITITTVYLDNPMPINGIISIPVSSAIPTGWFVCNGATVTLPAGGSVVTQNLTSNNLPGCQWIQKVY